MWVWFTCGLLQCRSHLLMHSKVGRAASSRTRCLSSGRCRLSRSIGDLRPSRRQQGSPVELRRSTQRGQAIVLIGIMVAVVVGMAALAVDGARAYALRRDLHAATAAAASASVNNLLYTPTIAALSQAGCGGMPGNAITTTSGGILNIVGDMVSSGAISIAGSASITGDVYARCQSSVTGVTTTCYPSGNSPPCTYPDVVGVTRSGYNFTDPRYPAPPLVGSAQSRPPTGGGPLVLAPGSYAMDPALGTGLCYFLAGGAYKWQGGYTNNGSFVSNELRPPDQPIYHNNNLIPGHHPLDPPSVGG